MAKGQSTITEVHDYIREHYKVGDELTLHDLRECLQWLKPTNISSALYKLEQEARCTVSGEKKRFKDSKHPFMAYVCTEEMFADRKRSIKKKDHTRDIPIGKKHHAVKRTFKDSKVAPATKMLSRIKHRTKTAKRTELHSIIELLLIVAERLETYIEEN